MMEEIARNLSEATATSVDAYMATWITIALIAFLLIVVPLLEKIPKLKDCVSRRWVIVTITTTLMVSVVINFKHLNDSVRESIIIGGFVVGIAYILIRSVESLIDKGWTFGVKHIEGDWQNKRIEVEMDTTQHPAEKPEDENKVLDDQKDALK